MALWKNKIPRMHNNVIVSSLINLILFTKIKSNYAYIAIANDSSNKTIDYIIWVVMVKFLA